MSEGRANLTGLDADRVFLSSKYRSKAFAISFASLSALIAIICYPLSWLGSDRLVRPLVSVYGRCVLLSFKSIIGVKISYIGRENIPRDGSVIFAPKHQSYADGYSLYHQKLGAAFVLGRRIYEKPILHRIAKRMGFLIADERGGPDGLERLKSQVRALPHPPRIVIFPEGKLNPLGTTEGYRQGIFHLYQMMNCPVVPVASNIGIAWPLNEPIKRSAHVTFEYLSPIERGLTKGVFMETLERRIETATAKLIKAEFSRQAAVNDKR